MEAMLRKRLVESQRTLRRVLFWKRSGLWSGLLLVLLVIAWWAMRGRSSQLPVVPAATGILWLVGLAAIYQSIRRRYEDWHDLALHIEARFPELKESLVTAAQSLKDRDAGATRHSNYLQRVVWQQTLEHSERTGWHTLADRRAIRRGRAVTCLALAVVGLFAVGNLLPSRTAALPNASIANDRQANATIMIDPGHAEVERGTSLVVSARFEGKLPARPVLVRLLPDGSSMRVDLKQRLEDPLFAVQLTDIQQPFQYQVEFDGQTSDAFRVDVFDYPALVQADAELVFPEFTRQPIKQVTNTRRVSVVEGTQIHWQLHLNKPVARAWLEDEDGQKFELTQDPVNPQRLRAEVIPEKDRRWQLHLLDDRERKNQLQSSLTAQVLANRLPTIKSQVQADRDASPLEEVPVRASYWDDFGLQRYGFQFSVGTQEPQEVVLGSEQSGGQNVVGESTMDFERLGSKPDDLVAYHFWAEDLDAMGETRRVTSDLYFVEVRQFEEVFRQGTQSGEGQSGEQAGAQGGANGSPSANLLELQKKILTGTWNLLRRQTTRVETEKLAQDLEMLRTSQEQAQADLQELTSRAEGERLATILSDIDEAMSESISQLKAAEQKEAKSLSLAVSAEQRSYQGLLQLREHEHEVIRGNRNSSSASGQSNSGPSQQQLQELQLEEDVNRYESERQAAQATDSPEERERRQIQSRLQDLARRQEDVNREMSQLQNELQLAREEQQRQEAEELRLKRLREHQQELMDEVDEVVERMDRASDPQNWQQAREQVQQSRERMQQSQQAAEQGQPGQALASGARAQQQLRETADQLRQQSADQFQQQIDSLTQDAERLEQQQQQLTDQMRESNSPSPGLRGIASSDQMQERIQQQKQALEKLLQELQNTIQTAESSEPLLARQLYDLYQQTEKERIQQKFDTTRQQLEMEQREQASEMSQAIAQDLSSLRQGIQQTGRDVLGSDMEAWRRAADELERLTEALREGQNPRGRSPESSDDNRRQVGNGLAQDDPARDDGSADETNESDESLASDSGRARTGDESPAEEQTGDPNPSGGARPESLAAGERSPSGSSSSGSPSAEGERDTSESSQSAENREAGGGGGSAWDAARAVDVLTGPTSEEWIDRLRDVEEVLDDSDFRSRAAQIRDRVREIRRESRRNSKEPQWSMVEELVASPLEELRDAVAEEVVRRSGNRNALVPIDRDPVPAPFAERVREYYERLGTGQ